MTYITRPDIKQPLFAQYCDGKKSKCPTWMTQWGSKDLGDKGYKAIDILKNFYGSNIYLEAATKVSGIPTSFTAILSVGSRGNAVKTIQEQINGISKNYPAFGKLKVDGIFGEATKKAVTLFQEVFNLPKTGVVNSATWYSISNIFVAVSKLS